VVVDDGLVFSVFVIKVSSGLVLQQEIVVDEGHELKHRKKQRLQKESIRRGPLSN
jgi:hypothetical protein